MKLLHTLILVFCCGLLPAQSFNLNQFSSELGFLSQFTKTDVSSNCASGKYSMGLGAMINLNYYLYNDQAISTGVRYRRYNPIFEGETVMGTQYFHSHIINAISIPLSYKVEKNLSSRVIGFVSLGTEMTIPIHIVEFPANIDNNLTTYELPKFNLGLIVDVGVKYPIGRSHLILSTTLNLSFKKHQIANYSYDYDNNNCSTDVLYNYSYASINLLYSFNIANTVERIGNVL